uniref:Uncharacterized protein n=1 Tax=Acrobeloides nanus TaxID=290746 RepID=A0A914E466_9BILA
MELFGQASHKVVVDVTASSAFLPIASFGYNCISKAARKMAFDTLAKERNDIKVLYFQPGIVYSPGFEQVIKQTFNPELKAMFQAVVDNKETMCQTGDHVGRVLVNYIEKDEFASGKFVNATKENDPEDIETTISKMKNVTTDKKN